MKRDELNRLSGIVLDSSIEVHRNLGPGLLESVYETCLCKEFDLRKINYQRQVSIPIKYKGEQLDADYRIDILVENEIIIELKSVDIMHPVFKAQLLTYLKLANKNLGLLINFNVPKLVDGFKRMVNGEF
ncbi:GxxExxY protein [Bacteroidota bacterium]